MLVSIVYAASLIAVCSCALVYGGTAERQTAIVRALASMASLFGALIHPEPWSEILLSVAVVDAVSCAASFAIMVRSRANWTIVSFGFTTAEVWANVARALPGQLPALAYYLSEAIWGYPLLTVLAIGTWQHHKTMVAKRSGLSFAHR